MDPELTRLEAYDILIDCALRFDGYLYLEETGFDTNQAIQDLASDVKNTWNELETLAVFFILQRSLCKWSLVYEPSNGKYWRLFCEMFFEVVHIPIPSGYEDRERHAKWESLYSPRLDEVIKCVQKHYDSTQWDDNAKYTPPKRSDAPHVDISKAYAEIKRVEIKFTDGVNAKITAFSYKSTWTGFLEGVPTHDMNVELINDLEEQGKVVIEPDWEEILPKYQVTCSLHSHEEIGPYSELGSLLDLVFFTDNVDNETIPEMVQNAVTKMNWSANASGLDLP